MVDATKSTPWEVPVLMTIGALWGLAEAGVGYGLRGVCNNEMSGSIMTGLAFFFIASGAGFSRRPSGFLLILAVVLVLKIVDAALLQLPILHGAIANPMFAFCVEVFAFALILLLAADLYKAGWLRRSLSGAMVALAAANLFPLVGHVTGIPACVMPGTAYPASLYYAPLAVGIALISTPVGFHFGTVLRRSLEAASPRLTYGKLFIAATAAVSLSAILLIDLFLKR